MVGSAVNNAVAFLDEKSGSWEVLKTIRSLSMTWMKSIKGSFIPDFPSSPMETTNTSITLLVLSAPTTKDKYYESTCLNNQIFLTLPQ